MTGEARRSAPNPQSPIENFGERSEKVAEFISRTSPDELIVTGQIFDHSARVYSYEILQEVAVPSRAAQPEVQAASKI